MPMHDAGPIQSGSGTWRDEQSGAALELSESDREMLTTLSRSGTAPAREVTRAKVLLRYAAGLSISQIQREVGVSRPTIYKCVDKALAAGVRTGLRDRYHRPREPEILPDAKAWVVSVACQQPKALGLAAKLWTLSALATHLQREAEAAGFPRLSHISRSSVWRILQEHDLKPHRVRYYLERRDPEFDRKMREVLMVYREVFLTPAPRDAATPTTYTVVRGREAWRTGYRHHRPGPAAGSGATGDAVARL